MASNGPTISDKSRMTIGLVVSIIVVLLTVAGGYWQMAASVQAHMCNPGAHHTAEYLDRTYARQEQFRELADRLDRIESKIDRLTERAR